MKNKFFKILAATAIVSATMAISSVAAMASTYKLDMADFFNDTEISDMATSGYVNTNSLTKDCTVNASDDSSTMAFNFIASGSTDGNDAFSLISYLEENYTKELQDNDAGYTMALSTNGGTNSNGKRQIQFKVPENLNAKVTVDYFRRSGSRTIGVYPSGSTTATASFQDSSISWTLKSETLTGIEGGEEGATYGVSISGSGLYICGITIETYDPSSVSTYSVSGTVTLDGSLTEGITVNYGTSTYVTGSDGAFTFTGIEEGTNVTLSVTGTDEYTSASVTVENISEDITGLVIALESKAKRQVITDKASFTVSQSDYSSTTTETYVVDDYFTILTGVSTDKGNTVSGITFDGRLKFGGTTATSSSIPTNRAIAFETSDAATVQICARSADYEKERSYYVVNSSGTTIKTINVQADAFSEIIKLPSADVYYIGCDDNVGIYCVNVVVGGSLETLDDGAIYADKTDSYVIAGVTADKLTAEALTIKADDSSTTELDSTTTVYENVYVDGNLISASDVGSFDYIYAVKVEETNGSSSLGFTATAE